MSGETETNVSGWTVDTLHQHVQIQLRALTTLLDERQVAQDAAVTAALNAAKEAVSKAEMAADKRFDGVNEFRKTLADNNATFMPREVADSQVTDLRKQMQILAARVDQGAGRDLGTRQTLGYMVAAATIVISVVAVLANVLTR